MPSMRTAEASRKDDWDCLAAELTRIDLLLRREARRWALSGQDPDDDYRGLYVTQLETSALLERSVGVSWGQNIILPAEEDAAFQQALEQAETRCSKIVVQAQARGHTPRLHRLARAFGLDQTALDIFLLCCAPAIDTKYERLFGYLQDNVNRRQPTIRLVLDLFGPIGLDQFELARHLRLTAPLINYRLLHKDNDATSLPHWINQSLLADDTVVDWLIGYYEPHGHLANHAQLYTPEWNESEQYLIDGFVAELGVIAKLLNRTDSGIAVFWGSDHLVQKRAAAWLAIHLNRPLLHVDLGPVIGEGCSPLQAVDHILRDALLTDAIPFIEGWDLCLADEASPSLTILERLYQHVGPQILVGKKAWQPQVVAADCPLYMLEISPPSYSQRLQLWERIFEELAFEPALPSTNGTEDDVAASTAPIAKVGLTELAGQFALTSRQIQSAAVSARHHAAQQKRDVLTEDLFHAARAYSSSRLNSLARKIEPRYDWDDIVLPRDQVRLLQELVATVRQRPKVLEEWGLGKKLTSSAGITVLFSGPPGTGKTMAAEVIGASLRLDLYKIDLASIVSKYIGETEKNLERIFTEAASSNAILFFDEADAIFGKRSEVKDAHDRYANIEVSYLLQRMEAYDGVTILATNLRANLDEAFARRLQFAIDFPFPVVENRLRIWHALFPQGAPRDLDLDFDLLAKRFEMTGGNIRNVIVSAAYLAANDGQSITMAHLMHGARRELQKMGRLVGEGDFIYR